MPKACDARTEGPRDRVAAMFAPLAKAKLIAADELGDLYKDLLEFLEDEVVDVPHIAKYHAKFIAHAVAAELVTLAAIAAAMEPLKEATLVKPDVAIDGRAGAAFMFVAIIQELAKVESCGEAGAKRLFDASKLDIASLLPEGAQSESAAVSLLDAGGVTFLAPEKGNALKAEAAKAASDAMKQQLTGLETYLTSGVLAPPAEGADGSAGVADAIRYIDENCSSALEAENIEPKSAKIERIVMRCVLEAGLGDEALDKAAPKLCKQIERCAKLLQKCTASSASESKRLYKQASCLYEVQHFCFNKEWPSGLIKKLFYNLYETDVVFEDAYGVWREDVVDTTPGKDRALFQVNEFLQWLDEAAEEGEGEEEVASP